VPHHSLIADLQSDETNRQSSSRLDEISFADLDSDKHFKRHLPVNVNEKIDPGTGSPGSIQF